MQIIAAVIILQTKAKDEIFYSYQGLQVWCPKGFECGRIKLKSGTELLLVQYAKDPRFSATISHRTPDSTDSKEVLERVANLTYLVKQSYHLKSLPVVEVVKFGGHKFARTSITREKWMLLTGYVPIKHKVYFAEFHYPKKGEENGQDIGQWLESIVKKTYFDLAKRSKIQSSQSFK